MNRLVAAGSAVAAAALVSVPAVLGLAGNPSFSHRIPVQVPSQVPDGLRPSDLASLPARPTPSPASTPTRHDEPGEDHGSTTRHNEPGDDHGSTTQHSESGDDHGGGGGGKHGGRDG